MERIVHGKITQSDVPNNLNPVIFVSKISGILPYSFKAGFTLIITGLYLFVIFSSSIGACIIIKMSVLTELTHDVTVFLSWPLLVLIRLVHLIMFHIKNDDWQQTLLPILSTDVWPEELQYSSKWIWLVVLWLWTVRFMHCLSIGLFSILAVSVILLFHAELAILATSFLFCTLLEIMRWNIKCQIRNIKVNPSNASESSKKFHEIINNARAVMSLLSPQMLLVILLFFVEIMISLYMIIDASNRHSMGTTNIILFLSSLGLNIFQLFIICHECERFNQEVENFHRVILNRTIAIDALSDHATLRMIVAVRETADFTACGFFRIGHPLITSMTATVATYLVIVVQFDSS